MSILVYIDQSDNHVKKSAYEVLTYGAKLAEQLGTQAAGIILGTVNDSLADLGKYGVKTIHQVSHQSLNQLDTQVAAKIIAEAAQTIGATVLVFSQNHSGKAIAARVAARLKAGLVAGAAGLPDTSNGFVVKKQSFPVKHLPTSVSTLLLK